MGNFGKVLIILFMASCIGYASVLGLDALANYLDRPAKHYQIAIENTELAEKAEAKGQFCSAYRYWSDASKAVNHLVYTIDKSKNTELGNLMRRTKQLDDKSYINRKLCLGE
jgi:hypothetical protein